jgi:hypothetical protein
MHPDSRQINYQVSYEKQKKRLWRGFGVDQNWRTGFDLLEKTRIKTDGRQIKVQLLAGKTKSENEAFDKVQALVRVEEVHI